MVGVGIRQSAGWKMFATGLHAIVAEVGVKHSCIANDLLGVGAITATSECVVGRVIVGNIEHWAEVHIKSKESEDVGGEFSVTGNVVWVVFFSELLGRWRFGSHDSSARDTPTFLIDGNDWGDFAKVA